jgi:amino acid transporter
MEPRRTDPRPIPPRLGLWDTISIIVGIIIGVGIFKTPADVFSHAAGPWQTLAIWILGGILALVGAFCFAELASTYPRSGGEYVYLTRAYGPWAGFLFAWAQLSVIRTGGSIAMLAYVFAYYAGKLFDLDPEVRFAYAGLAALVILALTGINILGVYLSKGTQNLLTVVKVLSLALILVVGLFWSRAASAPAEQAVHEGVLVQSGKSELRLHDPNSGAERSFKVTPNARITVDGNTDKLEKLPVGSTVKVRTDSSGAVTRVKVTQSLLAGFALAMILVLWTYAGWHEGAYVAAEVQNRRRNLPLALILGTGAVVLLYLLVNLAYLLALGYEKAADSPAVAADVLARLPLEVGGQQFGEKAMCVLVMISALGAINGMVFTSSRIYSELGADHRLFSPLQKWDPRWGTPVRSLLLQAVVSVAFVAGVAIAFAGKDRFGGEDEFATLLNCTAPVFWLFFLLTGVALFVLRFKDRDIERPFVTPAYPLTPLLFCGFCAFMLYSSVRYAPREAMVGLAILLGGIPLYFASHGGPSLVTRCKEPDEPVAVG